MSDWMKRIIESKRAARREFAAQPYAEKLRIVERLRAAAELFRPSRPAMPAKRFASFADQAAHEE